ncbi:MAG: alpha-ketoglutarate-dependent dioxygenase AlkB [Myxococcota bacterium]
MLRWFELGAGARYGLCPDFLGAGEAQATFQALCADLAWGQGKVRIFGKDALEPRLTAYYGEPGANYRYSGHLREPLPFTEGLLRLRDQIAAASGIRFNSVLANLYRDGQDSMGFHQDDEPELGPDPAIASLSLGATRIFVLKKKAEPGIRIPLVSGSLLVMNGRVQDDYRHGIPKTARPVGPRINLSFRRIVGT